MNKKYRRAANSFEPSAPLPAAAERLLASAQQLVIDQGFEALTLDAVAEEAGAYRGSVRYYFGTKAGLIAALIDVASPRTEVDGTALEGRATGERGLRASRERWSRVAENLDSQRAFFELLPHVLRSPELRTRVADLYRAYRQADVDDLAAESGIEQRQLTTLATVIVAAVDGLSELALLDPEGVDLKASCDVLAEMTETYLGRIRDQRSS
jgi:AcrR family transcriptional regulator